MHPAQKEALQALSPAEKFRMLGRLWRAAWTMKAAYLRLAHPTWRADEVEQAVRDAFAHVRR